ncbi:MAG TPA: substrate-binding domain-containing protein [Tepidisphaeraceae bacterium]|jgi:ribose transport system substrate-binding protein|nr:substrate-binding domain-containing protein [Tepidisphaeraceae bacterium]
MRAPWLLALAAAVVTATSLLPHSVRADDKKYTIAVIPKGTTHEYWKSVHAGAMKAAQETGAEIIWKGPLKEDDRQSQIDTVDNFVNRQVNGICLAPLDDTALRAPIRAAKNAGIPVVIFDSGVKGNDYVSLVATDNFKGGQIAGEELARLINNKGKVIMLRYAVGSASTEQREEGFLDAIKKHPDIQVVADNQYGGATTESAYQASENMLAPLKNADGSLSIDGIYACNESTSFGMLRALQEGGWAGKIKYVGFDASTKLVEGLKAGQINGLVVQNPFKMGYLSVKTMVDKLNGKDVEKRIDTGATLVTKDNMAQPEIDELLHPDLAKWLKE